jgi:hypothetical protein
MDNVKKHPFKYLFYPKDNKNTDSLLDSRNWRYASIDDYVTLMNQRGALNQSGSDAQLLSPEVSAPTPPSQPIIQPAITSVIQPVSVSTPEESSGSINMDPIQAYVKLMDLRGELNRSGQDVALVAPTVNNPATIQKELDSGNIVVKGNTIEVATETGSIAYDGNKITTKTNVSDTNTSNPVFAEPVGKPVNIEITKEYQFEYNNENASDTLLSPKHVSYTFAVGEKYTGVITDKGLVLPSFSVVSIVMPIPIPDGYYKVLSDLSKDEYDAIQNKNKAMNQGTTNGIEFTGYIYPYGFLALILAGGIVGAIVGVKLKKELLIKLAFASAGIIVGAAIGMKAFPPVKKTL